MLKMFTIYLIDSRTHLNVPIFYSVRKCSVDDQTKHVLLMELLLISVVLVVIFWIELTVICEIGGSTLWLPRSPVYRIFNPIDLYLCGHLKTIAHATMGNIQDLRYHHCRLRDNPLYTRHFWMNRCVDVSLLVFKRMVNIFNICCNYTQGHNKTKYK